jgi:eukaryotic-like serine/threonine-protein kinase
MTPAPGSIVGNRFRLVRELGRGSMGTVWLADHLTLGVRCAVKFMTVEATRDPNYRARFAREARAIAQLHSPNVVRVLDYDVYDGVPFIAMEWLHGEDLEARLLRVGRLDPRTTHRILSQVAHGLARAHEAGIVHRALKPGNIFLAEEDGDEIAKLLDFGIAKIFAVDGVDSGTQAGTVLGTPAYMSPEQAREVTEIDYRSDLWSLAIIAYECLVGQLPFDGPSLGDIFARIMFEPIPVPSRSMPGLSRAFDRWWERAVSRDVEGRFTGARELVDELGRALFSQDTRRSHGELSLARSLPPLPRRRRSGMAVAAFGLTALLAVVVLPNIRIAPGSAQAEIGSRVRSAAHSIAQSAAGLTGAHLTESQPASPATVSVSPPSPALAEGSPQPLRPSVRENSTSFVREDSPAPLAEEETRPPAIASAQASATASKHESVEAPPRHEAPSKAAAPSPSLAPPADPPIESSPVRTDCSAGQHRCQGRELQVCNEALDGWTDVLDCGALAVCDATGSGRCVPPPSQPGAAEAPTTSDTEATNPY